MLEKVFLEDKQFFKKDNKDIIDINFDKNPEKEIYFICYLETKLDKTTKRGAILKSVSIGTTKLMNLNVFRPILKFLLDEIFKAYTFKINDEEKLNLIKRVCELIYKNFNNLDTIK